MQVTLNIDADNMGSTIQEIFANLTQEKKEELAASVILKWMDLPYSFERKAFEEKLIVKHEALRKEKPSDYYQARLEDNYRFKDELNGFKSTREEFLLKMIKLGSDQIEKTAIANMQSDPVFQKTVQATLKGLEENYQAIVQKAFADQMSKHFFELMTTGMHAYNNTLRIADSIKHQTGVDINIGGQQHSLYMRS